jgi:hypothetical protein
MMKLPTEMRVRIYGFALQHILDAIYDEAPSHEKLWRPVKKSRSDPGAIPFYTGALALTQINRAIRAESLDTLPTLMLAHIKRLEGEIRNVAGSAVRKRTRAMREDFDFEALQAALSQVAKLGNSAIQVKWICYTMAWTKGR